MSIVIRPARPDDAAAILDMVRALARFERAEHAVKASVADLVRDGWGPAPRFEALIAERDGTAAGYALFFANYSTWEGRAGIHLEDLYVREAERRSGLGRRLLAAVAAIAVARGCPRLDLAVLDWNPARGFYDRLGFAWNREWLAYRLSGEALNRLAELGGAPAPADEAPRG